jgi:PAS domain S-box-containing protein
MQASNGEVPTEILQELEPRSFGLRSTELAVCPIFSGVEAVCFIIVGLNPKKRFCAAYQSFLQRLTSEIIGPRVGSILLAHEQERGRILTQQAEDERTLRIHELEQSEMKYRRFAEHAPLGMVRLDTKGDLVYANAAWKVIFGFTPGDSHSRPWLKRIHPDHVELAQQFFEDVCQNKGPVTIEHRLIWIVNKDREEDHRNETQPAWLLVTGYLEDDNHVVCWVTDISAQKAAAMALNEKMEEAILQRTRQENFIDMISHEIRNPMSAVLHCTEDIIGSANKLLKQQDIATLPPILSGCLESAQTILYCIQHQKRIIDDVLTLSKLDADLLEIALVPVEPRKVIQTSLKIFDRELKDSKIKLKIIEDASLDALDICVLMLDPNRFLQIIVNLVTNGIKFTRTSRRKEITVRISASTTRPTLDNVRFFPPIKKPTKANDAVGAATNTYGTGCEQLYLAVSVSDTGKGLSDNERQHLFNKFAQASPKTHIEYGGSGLGLFISRHITEMMNGQIGVAHGQQEGCTFAFFVQTQRVAIDDASEQTLLVAATDRLTVNVTHHPVSPMLSPTATSAEPTRPRSISSPQHPVSPPMESGNAITDTTTRPRLGTVQSDLNLRLTPTMRKAKILVVEDNLINQKVVCKQLRARGYDVHAANHGVEALQALQDAATTPSRETRYFSIVLCDIEMPIMNGLMCAQEVRKLEQEKRLPGHIPMVAVTANARGLHVDKAFEAGMVCLIKAADLCSRCIRLTIVDYRMMSRRSLTIWKSSSLRLSALSQNRKFRNRKMDEKNASTI